MVSKVDNLSKSERYKAWIDIPGNRDKKNAKTKEWRVKNKARITDYKKEYRTPEVKAAEYAKHLEWKQRNPDRIENYKERNRLLIPTEEQRQRRRFNNRTYAKKPENIIKHREKVRHKYNEDVQFKIINRLRSRLYKCMKGKKSSSHSLTKYVGCTKAELIEYLSKMFVPGMTWENHGKWHIDHILPLSSFDLTDIEQFKKAAHFSNLQPLWAHDNMIKSNKI